MKAGSQNLGKVVLTQNSGQGQLSSKKGHKDKRGVQFCLSARRSPIVNTFHTLYQRITYAKNQQKLKEWLRR